MSSGYPWNRIFSLCISRPSAAYNHGYGGDQAETLGARIYLDIPLQNIHHLRKPVLTYLQGMMQTRSASGQISHVFREGALAGFRDPLCQKQPIGRVRTGWHYYDSLRAMICLVIRLRDFT